jgi:hypothetical protein
MQITDMSPETLVDIFGNGQTENGGGSPGGFKMEEINTDIFNPNPNSITETTTVAASSTTETTTISSTTETTTLLENADILNADKEKDENGKEVVENQELTGLSDYFKKRIEEGKLVPVMQEDEQGNQVPFIPTTPEEVDEVINLQISYQLEQKQKEVEESFYKSKSPVWKAILQHAENIDTVEELMPFLQGVSTIQSVAQINETEIDGAEQILKIQMAKSGQPQEFIDAQIEALKTTNKLVETAQKLKPVLLQEEAQRLTKLKQEEAVKVQKYREMVIEIRDNALKAIETPLGKESLKPEEKAAIYDLIAVPEEEGQGYAIYNKIDDLFKAKDFETLRQLALFLTHKDTLVKHLTTEAVNKNAQVLQKKLILSTERQGGGKDPNAVQNQPVIRRDQFNKKPSFGR